MNESARPLSRGSNDPAEAQDVDTLAGALGTWVRSNRLAQRISQRELAERAGVSRSYVGDIERGRGVRPSLETLDKLASSLGAARIHILQAAGVVEGWGGNKTDAAELRLVSLYRDLSDEGRLTVERFVQFVHAEESRWSQASFITGDGGALDAPPVAVASRQAPPLFTIGPADDDVGTTPR